MKKIKMFLVGLALLATSSFAFAIEKNVNNDDLNKNFSNQEQEGEEENSEEEENEEKGMFVEGNLIKNFSLTEEEKKQLEYFFQVINRLRIKKNRIEEILKLQMLTVELKASSNNPLEIEEFNDVIHLRILKHAADGKHIGTYHRFLGLRIEIHNLKCFITLYNNNGNTKT